MQWIILSWNCWRIHCIYQSTSFTYFIFTSRSLYIPHLVCNFHIIFIETGTLARALFCLKTLLYMLMKLCFSSIYNAFFFVSLGIHISKLNFSNCWNSSLCLEGIACTIHVIKIICHFPCFCGFQVWQFEFRWLKTT